MSGPWDDYATDGPWADYQSSPEPISVKAGRGIMEVPRQVGLSGRYALEGAAQVADTVAEPIRNLIINPIVRGLGGTPITSQTEAAGRLADKVGLPAPENANERTVADASRLLIGAGVMIGLGGSMASGANTVVRGLGRGLSAAPGLQASGAVGAGLAGGATREAGGGPGAQLTAAIAGGLATPLAVNSLRGPANTIATNIRKIVAPKDIEATLKVELNRAGIDWDTLGHEAQAALKRDARNAVYSGEPLDTAALRRLTDFRIINATPLKGDITQDPRTLTLQRNLSKQLANVSRPLGEPDLPTLQNENAKRVISTLEGMTDSPLDSYGTGSALIDKVQQTDDALKSQVSNLYSKAQDSAGRALPLDRAGFVDTAFSNLAKSNKGAFLPGEVEKMLNDISVGQVRLGDQVHDVPFDVNTIDSLKTTLATASRSTRDGNVKAAIKAVRDALEDVQPTVVKKATGSEVPVNAAEAARLRMADALAPPAAEQSLAAFDAARKAARSRFAWQESAPFIADALDGATPDKFVQKHIIMGSVKNLEQISESVSNVPELREGVRRQIVDHVMRRGGADADVTKFSSDGMKRALDAIGDRKLELFFSPDEVTKIKAAVNVGRYMQSQPIGSAVNNSNTAAMLMGRLTDILLRGASRVPALGPLVAEPLRGLALNVRGQQMANVGNALIPAAQRHPIPVSPLLLAAGTPSRNE